jgi:endoglucanase
MFRRGFFHFIYAPIPGRGPGKLIILQPAMVYCKYLALALLTCPQLLPAQSKAGKILLDQEGFYPGAPKIAVITGVENRSAFFVIREKSRDTLYRGILSDPRKSSNSSLYTRIAEFSSLRRPGRFYLSVAGCPDSYPFTIGPAVHRKAAVSSLKGFYFLRASMPLEARFAGKWSRPEGHPDTLVFIHPSAASPGRKAGTAISTPGGWYDAGDYNKYIVNSGISMGTLLSAYEDFKTYFDTLHTNIPSAGKKIPDLLNEIIYNLRWMLAMQDPADGGVYNKCTNAAFDAMIMPAAATEPRYVVAKGTAATLDFAAVTAQAGRVLLAYKKELPGLGDSCLRAAEKAWDWALQHPDQAYDQNAINRLYEPKITTGAYGDRHFSDEWFWAASELSISTSRDSYQKMIPEHMNEKFPLPSWSQTGLLGYYSLLRFKRKIPQGIKDTLEQRLLRMADGLIQSAASNAFLTVMGSRPGDFVWGSNANAANEGILLINAYALTRNPKYLLGAMGNLEYICGRNATGYCFITGIGSHSTRHPHHRPSVADGIEDPVPGLLAGGPNPGEQDHCHYEFQEPETAYLDSDCAYASNEIAINWNAPLVYLANAVEALNAHGGIKRRPSTPQ